MQGKKQYQEKLFSSFQLSERVPEDNFYRRLKTNLDLSFLRQATKSYYGKEGQQSIDPEVFFKLILVGYIENLNSDRKIINHARMRLDILFFIGYDIDEELPWHSTLTRTRQLFGEEIFLELFKKILSLCVSKGMVSGKRQAVDSAYIKANASMDSLSEKEILDDAKAFSDELKSNDETISEKKKQEVEAHHKWKEQAYQAQPKGRQKTSEDTFEDEKEEDEKRRGKFLSNHTHYSTTDPDARISVKPGKPRQLTYSAQTSVDTKHHVITGICADYSSKRDSESLNKILNQTIDNLKQEALTLQEVLADAGYSSGKALRYLKFKNITGYIPNFGQYKATREGFVYNAEQDQYECVKENGSKATLPHKRTAENSNGYVMKTYRSSETVCKSCPLRASCIGKSNFKKIDDTIDKPLYDEMHQRLQTRKAKLMKKLRSSTVEPVLGTLINFTGMRRIWTRGIEQANKFMLGAATAYNLKKWLNYNPRARKVAAKQKPGEQTSLIQTLLSRLFYRLFNEPKFSHSFS
jgi:transposase